MALTKDLPADDKFDVLIIDEASQLRLSHALALCGHASQIIVAGDSRQLQPRDSEVGVDQPRARLLARARLAGLPVVTLERHYRSRHPSLIAWSNAFSYEVEVEAQFGALLAGGCRLRCGLCSTRRVVFSASCSRSTSKRPRRSPPNASSGPATGAAPSALRR